MSESKATPRPWTKDGNGIHKGTSCVAITYGDNKLADADLIFTAVNAHDDLLEACKAMLGDYEDQYGMDYCECDSSVGLTCNACRCRVAIAKGETQ